MGVKYHCKDNNDNTNNSSNNNNNNDNRIINNKSNNRYHDRIATGSILYYFIQMTCTHTYTYIRGVIFGVYLFMVIGKSKRNKKQEEGKGKRRVEG